MKKSEDITPRERTLNSLDFKEVDTIPWSENFYDETLNKFFSEGLPAHKITVIE